MGGGEKETGFFYSKHKVIDKDRKYGEIINDR